MFHERNAPGPLESIGHGLPLRTRGLFGKIQGRLQPDQFLFTTFLATTIRARHDIADGTLHFVFLNPKER
jgi:hypothetical protein